MTDMLVAATILHQLGGKRFLAMTGAKNLTASNNSLTMQVNGQGKHGRVNKVVIRLDPSDTYTVQAYDCRAGKARLRYETDDIYFDVLPELFERITGLRTSL